MDIVVVGSFLGSGRPGSGAGGVFAIACMVAGRMGISEISQEQTREHGGFNFQVRDLEHKKDIERTSTDRRYVATGAPGVFVVRLLYTGAPHPPMAPVSMLGSF
eukprot:TRINITY_DN8945_c0_g4_i1.p2 TRINITY_DN8945_c0_g4~~TRINITY_DN8945_c0_g4_i1.p2  ORF type:complete len:104 (-),score=0.48 TRINITY_DN8945_c0_g4_i1:20-331(-)